MPEQTANYLKEWQEALQKEINHLMKFGSGKHLITNGRLLSEVGSFNYYFDIGTPIRIPIGSSIRLEQGNVKQQGRMLSVEGRGVILSLEKSLGDLIEEAYLYHDPWELLEQLIQRLDEVKEKKNGRLRIKKMMDPSMPAKHPETSKGNVHELILRSKYNPVTYVWGPPGTGKTYTLARVAANKYFKEKRVLILSHSNQAVDVLLTEIAAFIKKKNRFVEGDVLRYGNHSEKISLHEEITTSYLVGKKEPNLASNKDQLSEERRLLKQDIARSFSKRDSQSLLELEKRLATVLEKIRQKEVKLVKDAYIIGTTLAKAASDEAIYSREYDVVIIDEASMAYVPQIAFATSLGKRVIICGDFKQLPPIASSRDPLVNKWLKEDVFHRSGVVDWVKDNVLHPHLFLLKEQRRMHPDISAFTNRFIYQNLVGDHQSVSKNRNGIVKKAPFPNHASILVDTSFTGEYCISERTSKSKLNLWQLFLSFQLIHEAYLAGAKTIGYVTPYRAQANLMQLLLDDVYQVERMQADIISATVHRFQGSERDVMVFDTVDSYPLDRAGMLLTGKESERLINVAITRTKGKFIHVNNKTFIKERTFRNKTIRQLVDFQEANHQVVQQKNIGYWIKNQHPRLQWMHARKTEKFFQDIKEARQTILISLPKKMNLPQEWEHLLKTRRANVELTMITVNPHLTVNPSKWISTEPLPFPFIIIDRQYSWLGMPISSSTHIQPPYVAVRLDSGVIAEQFLSQLPIDEK